MGSQVDLELQRRGDTPEVEVTGRQTSRRTNKCCCASIVVLAIVICALITVAATYIAIIPKINKDLGGLPTSGYLTLAEMNSFMGVKDCGKMTAEDYGNLTALLTSLRNNGTQSFAFYCEAMVTPNGLADGVEEPLRNFLTTANREGVSVGMILLESQLKNKEFVAAIKSLPFIAFYHYTKDATEEQLQAIVDFGSDINKERPYIIERTNNIIFDTDKFANIAGIKLDFKKIDGIVMPLESLSAVGTDNVEYPVDVVMMFMPKILKISNAKFNAEPYADARAQIVDVSRCAFLSNASVLVGENRIAPGGKLDFTSTNSELANLSLSFFQYLKNYVSLKNKDKIWKRISPKVTIKKFDDQALDAISYSFKVPASKDEDFSHLLLLQNMVTDSDQNGTYSLDALDVIPKDSIAKVLISFPMQTNTKNIVNIHTNSITLPPAGSIVLAVYTSEKAKTLTDVHKAWPVSQPN